MRKPVWIPLAILVVAIGAPNAQGNTTDSWNGGTGNWSNAGDWSAGEPVASNDVTIYSGGNDLVSLDISSATVNSLTLGGAANGFSSELDNGMNFTISNAFNIGQSGALGEIITPTGYGAISAGSASLDGALDILLQAGYNPAVGSTFKILNVTPGSLSGSFASITNDTFNGGTEFWAVDYENGAGYVNLVAESAVPEPSGSPMLLLEGLATGAIVARKRRAPGLLPAPPTIR